MIIRQYNESDLEKVVTLWDDCGLTVSWNDPRKDIARKTREKRELFLVGEKDGDIVASAMGGYDGHRGWVNYLAVTLTLQGRGYGKLMMREVENRLLKLGCPKINLMVRSTNEQAVRFYEKVGYKTDPVVCLGKRLIPDD